MNTTAAFNFLREIEEQKQKRLEDDGEASGSQKIVFKKSVKLRPRQERDELDPQIDLKKAQGNKIVMPEYVVGEKKRVERPSRPKTRPEATKTSKQLQLSHLNEDEEEEDWEKTIFFRVSNLSC